MVSLLVFVVVNASPDVLAIILAIFVDIFLLRLGFYIMQDMLRDVLRRIEKNSSNEIS